MGKPKLRSAEDFMNKTEGACNLHPEGCPDGSHLPSNLRMADVPREILLGKTLRQRAHELRIEACGAWSDVVEKPIAGLDAAKCDYAKAIEERLCAIIDELADLSSPVETTTDVAASAYEQIAEVLNTQDGWSVVEHVTWMRALLGKAERELHEVIGAKRGYYSVQVLCEKIGVCLLGEAPNGRWPEEDSAQETYTNEAPSHPPILPERFNSVSLPEKASGEPIYECCNDSCLWRGLESETVHPKHEPSRFLCPECHEVVELV